MAVTQEMPGLHDTELDTLGHLEDRIQKAVALVNRLRHEKETALKELAASKAENARVAGEVESLQAERRQVRARLEKLLGHIDQLGS
jgi:FtsZ-binding cell division protein ZapB